MVAHGFDLSVLQREGFALSEVGPADADILAAARSLGTPFTPAGMPDIQTLRPRELSEAPSNTYSGNFGTGAFPFHTDMAHWHRPPRYMLFVCIVPDPQVATRIVRWRDVNERVDAGCLSRARFRPRRPQQGAMYRLRARDGDIHRWDSLFILPDNQSGRQLRDEMLALDLGALCKDIVLDRCGMALVIDNWRVLHARSPIAPTSPRVVKRVYIEGDSDGR